MTTGTLFSRVTAHWDLRTSCLGPLVLTHLGSKYPGYPGHRTTVSDACCIAFEPTFQRLCFDMHLLSVMHATSISVKRLKDYMHGSPAESMNRLQGGFGEKPPNVFSAPPFRLIRQKRPKNG